MRIAVVLLACAGAFAGSALAQGDAAAQVRSARERALRIEQAEGGESASLATALLQLGILLDAERADAEARAVLERALAIREKALGAEHTGTAAVLARMGLVLQRQGDLPNARQALSRALAIREKLLGPEHADTIATVNDLGVVLADMGELDAALPLFERALAAGEKVLGPRDARVASYLSNLGGVHDRQGRAKEAREKQERALAIREQILGLDNLETAESQHALALVLQSAGEYVRAHELYRSALSTRSKLLGSEHPKTVLTEMCLGTLLHAEGRLDDAQGPLEHALAVCESTLGDGHPTTLRVLGSLSALLAERGRYREARPLLQRMFAEQQKLYGGDHPIVAATLGRIALLLADLDNPAEAEPLLERAIAITERSLGAEHVQTAELESDLAALFQSEHRFVEAEPLFARALATFEKQRGPEHPSTATALDRLASCLKDQAKHARARPHFERALAIREKVLGPEHPDTSEVWQHLGELAHDEGDLSSARTALARALAIRSRVFGDEHPSTQRTARRLIRVLADRGERHAAWELAVKSARASTDEMKRALWLLAESERVQSIANRRATLESLLDLVPADSAVAERVAYDVVLEWKACIAPSLLEERERVYARYDAAAAAKLDELRGVHAELLAELSRQGILDRGAHDRRLAELRGRRAALERTLIERTASPADATSIDTAAVMRALPEGSALVDYFVHDTYVPAVLDGERVATPGRVSEPRLAVWVSKADADQPARIDLGPAHVVRQCARAFLESVQAQRAPSAVTTAGRSVFEEASARLIELVWTPVKASIGDTRLVFVSPDRFLGTLPFETLLQDDGTYLVEHFRFVYLLDAASLLDSARAGRDAEPSLLAVGIIDYNRRGEARVDDEAEEEAELAVPSGAFQGLWEELRFSGREATVVWELFTSTHGENASAIQLRDGLATETALGRAMPGRRYLHIATHGFVQPEGFPSLWERARADDGVEPTTLGKTKRITGLTPGLLSGLVCAGANLPPDETGDDGSLTAGEMTWLDLSKCDMVVLSACQTGLGTERGGEGFMNLRRALRMAGAKTVVASLWSIDDLAKIELMQAFYKRLWVEKQSKIDALRNAQLELLQKNRTAHQGAALPYTWGAFVLCGDWR